MTREIRTVGKIAYDPDLYVAQEEYLQALKMEESSGTVSEAPEVKTCLEVRINAFLKYSLFISGEIDLDVFKISPEKQESDIKHI